MRFVAEGRGDELPANVLAVLHARLAELEPELRRVLRAASVLGERFSAEGVAAVAGTGVESVRVALEALISGRIVTVPRQPGACSGWCSATRGFRAVTQAGCAGRRLTSQGEIRGLFVLGAGAQRATDAFSSDLVGRCNGFVAGWH
ncbi:MAG TPA: hypothetical protein VF331_21465 [Polyangiales bacterium]